MFQAEVVGFAEHAAGFDAGAGHPDREAAAVVVAAGDGGAKRALGVNGAAEFAAPDDQGVFEQAALLEIETRRGEGWSVSRHWLGSWRVMAMCWSQPRWKSWMKRTPRSARRRASRQLAA
jgi:hypothetical protein